MTNMNPELELTLDDAVAEVLGMLTGLELEYRPEFERYRAITRQLNRALRSMALEHEWSYYSDIRNLGPAGEGTMMVTLPSTVRPRMVGDDSVRFVDAHGHICEWAYLLPRDALHKYRDRAGLWASVTRNGVYFSRPLNRGEGALDVHVPVMREPIQFRLPAQPEDVDDERVEVDDEIRQQLIDFQYPDVIILRAAFYYAQSDPIMQPRVQTIEAQYKDIMYQIIERDDRFTDSPFQNEFNVPVGNSVWGAENPMGHFHPHSDERFGG